MIRPCTMELMFDLNPENTTADKKFGTFTATPKVNARNL